MTYDAIHPGRPWLDTAGQRIQAHGGSLFFENDTFYWYGENKERSTPGSGIWHWGIRMYSSTDLYNWHDLGLVIPPEPDDPESPLHPAQQVDRPHIVRNPATGEYVCWLKIMGPDAQLSTVLVSDALTGPYRIVRTGLAPLGMSAGDFDLVVDPTDGRGYYYFEHPHSELICADLTDDYTDVAGTHSAHFPRPYPPFVREAPAYFRRGDEHFLITSGTTWYFPNPSEVASAPDYHGPWTVLGDPHPGDTSGTSYRSQISSVFRHPGKRDLYIALGDRWLPGLSPEESNRTEGFRKVFSGEDPTIPEGEMVESDTSIADYVWLPIRFDGDIPTIDWLDSWRVEDYD